ncbi:MAG TPA: glycosyltransferase [Hyphomicrobiales bacterium]|nr:glycosyltransferase [Hyphomicrobiales bacterium]
MRIVLAALAVVACAHAALWAMTRSTVTAPSAPEKFASLSFAPFNPGVSDGNATTNAKQIDADLAAVAPYTRAIRTYSATRGLELVPAIAAKYGLAVTQGIWIDKDEKRNAEEIKSGIDLARKNPDIKSLVVGNETIFRGEKTAAEMVDIIRKVKSQVHVPVTMGEVWSTWINHPELVSAVDYIAIHVLPYWEGHPDSIAVDQALEMYQKLRRAYPGKHVVIAEFGWPSGGYNMRDAEPGRLIQARVIRDFMARAASRGIDYNIVEAIDQPWKIFEGSVGPYWGMFDASRHLKFPLTGPLVESDWYQRAAVALLIGLLLSLPILRLPRPTFVQAAALATAANGVGAWAAVFIDFWVSHYFVLGAEIAIAVGGVLLIPLAMVILSRTEEIAAVLFGREPLRLLPAGSATAPQGDAPKVSIHIPAYREPPDMLIKTLDSVARLDYPNFECVVVVNNTPDEAMWQPVAEHCAALGERFKFIHVDGLKGFKAGALRIALAQTATDASIIGVIDADYVVDPAWLKDLVPAFADAQVGLVQAPQDHRDGARSVLHHCMNTEYAGFFDIGMVERNEKNAIIVHGTMCLVRRAALMDAGGWSSDTICEDSDLGLAVLERGWTAHYTRRRYGWGLLPDGYDAFRKQRHRWAFGGVQIMLKHIAGFFSGKNGLAPAQRRSYLTGWMNWVGAETLGVAIALLNLVWVPVVVFGGIAIPEMVLTLPILASFVIYLVHFGILYSARVRHGPGATAGAALAAMALQLTVARATVECLVTRHMPFVRTAKGGSGATSQDFPAFWEAVLGLLLVFGCVLTAATNVNQVREIYLFSAVLGVEAMPFLAAMLIAVFERTPANDPALYARLERRLAAYIAGRPEPARAPAEIAAAAAPRTAQPG